MKLIFKILPIVTLSLLFESCNKDDDPIITGSLVGTWEMIDLHVDDGINETTFMGQMITSHFTISGSDYHSTITFTENPNMVSTDGNYTAITDIDLLGSDTTTVYTWETGTWSLIGEMLTQIVQGDTSNIEILELSDSKLRIKQNLEEMYSDTSFGFTVHETATVFSSFEKQ